MKVAVCDNNAAFLAGMADLPRRHAAIAQVALYDSAENFLTSVAEGEPFDLVLMDLDWGAEHTGLDYAEQLYRLAPHLPVIYMTGYNDRFASHVLLHKTNLAGYLTKPLDNDLLDRYLQKISAFRATGHTLTFQQQGFPMTVIVPRIVYLESSNHTVIIHTDTVNYKVYEQLNAIAARLPDGFVQCHKSYLVNMHWIQRMEPGHLVLTNGCTVPISRSCAARTRETVFAFLGLQI